MAMHEETLLEWSGSVSLCVLSLCQRVKLSSVEKTLMQLLFSFDRGMRVEKTFMQALASQLSCNSCSRLTGA